MKKAIESKTIQGNTVAGVLAAVAVLLAAILPAVHEFLLGMGFSQAAGVVVMIIAALNVRQRFKTSLPIGK